MSPHRKAEGGRTVRVMTSRQLSATAKLEGKTKGISKCEMDLSPDAMREAQRAEINLRIILYLLNAGTAKPPRATVEGADLEVQQMHAQLEALQQQDGILYRNFMIIGRQVRWR